MNTERLDTEKITALYERLSRDDDRSKVHKHEDHYVTPRMVSFSLFQHTNKFVVNRNDLFLALAIAAHTGRFIHRNAVN